MITISLFGLALFSNNKGCVALSYSFLDILNSIAQKNNIIFSVLLHIIISKDSHLPEFNNRWDFLDIQIIKISSIRKKSERIKLYKSLKRTDVCWDFTEGDSFTDLYGLKRFVYLTFIKSYSIFYGKKFILGPQTYGPFNSLFSRIWAGWILKNSYSIFSRDELSVELIMKLSRRKAIITTDIAMALKPIPSKQLSSKKIKVGINVSSLLYNGGYSGNNQFRLKTDYKVYINNLVKKLIELKKYHIYLIPHVISRTEDGDVENDLNICNLIKECFKDCEIISEFDDPSQLKDIISQMDVFAGARMHSTIAAFSSKIPTIPFSYSKKFEGLFNSVEYPYIIDGKNLETSEAIDRTIEYIENYKELKNVVIKSNEIINRKLKVFYDEVETILLKQD